MDSLKQLTDYLKTQSSGASFSELKVVFADEGDLRNFIKIGLESGIVQKEGEKRGTRYFVGSIVKKEEETSDFEKATDDIQVFLKSDKPCAGQPYLVKVEKFGEDNKSIRKFLDAGVTIRGTTIAHNKKTKQNEIIHEDIQNHYNMISISQEGRKFIFTKFFAEKTNQEHEEFDDYSDFREYLLANLI